MTKNAQKEKPLASLDELELNASKADVLENSQSDVLPDVPNTANVPDIIQPTEEDEKKLQNYSNVRTKQVSILSTRNAKDTLRRSYYNIEQQTPKNYQLCIGIIEGEDIPILSIYLEEHEQFYGVIDIKQNPEARNSNVNAIEVHGSITSWLPIYTQTSYQQAITDIHNGTEVITTPNYKDNMDAYYNKANENERPDHNQVCMILFNISNSPENLPLPILVAYDYNKDRFSVIDEVQRKRIGRYQRQEVVCEKIKHLEEISYHWIPVFTAFEYYKYDKSKRSLWRKAQVAKIKKQNPDMSNSQIIRKLNKIRPFPQIIMRIYDGNILK